MWTNNIWTPTIFSKTICYFRCHQECNIGPQSGGTVEDLPVHLFESFGQLQAKIPTEVLITDRKEFELADEGFIPLTMP